MSGKTKRIIYNILSFVLWSASVAGVVLLFLFTAPRPAGVAEYLVLNAVILAEILRIPALLHELGHLLFGWMTGMKFVGVTLSYVRISGGKIKVVNPNYAGATEMSPKKRGHMRVKIVIFALGGPMLCLVLGCAFLGLYLAMPYHAGWLFGGMMGILLLYEGLIALYPVELSAGKTDGAVLWGLLRRKSEEEVMLRVLTAQAVLYRGTYRDIERDLLFSAPVIREDLPAYHALLFLQINYLKEMGETEETVKLLERLRSLREYLTEAEKAELDRMEI